jgi:D-ribose pyranose/furanose isomerase RbsD
MGTVSLVLMVLAFIAFIVATAGFPIPPRVNMMALGLALWSLAVILGGVKV